MLAGLLGIGGGVVYIAVFTVYLTNKFGNTVPGDLMVRLLIANSVFALIFAGISGSIKNVLKKTFLIRPVVFIAIPASVCSVLTSYLVSLSAAYNKSVFAVLFTLFMIPIIVSMLLPRKENEHVLLPDYRASHLFSLGVVSGIVTALSGLGGGFIMVPVLNVLLKFPIRRAMATSLGVIGVVSFSLTIYNMFLSPALRIGLTNNVGPIILPMVLPMVAGVLVGTPLGVIFAHKLHPRILQLIFLVFCLVVIIKMLNALI